MSRRRLDAPMKLLLVAALSVAATGCGGSDMASDSGANAGDGRRIDVDDLELIPESMSRERATLLPTKPSEDARHVLGTIDLPPIPVLDEERDYLPEPAVDWVVDASLRGDPVLQPQKVAAAFDRDRYAAIGRFVIYGRDVETGLWSYLIAADGPQAVDRLKFAFDYVDVLDQEAAPPDQHVYAERLARLTEGMKELGEPSLSASLAPAAAAERSQLLMEALRDLDMYAVLRLQAPFGRPYDGKQVWDVMLCLGLQWGDMDCFHWPNDSGVGDDYFFSVETSTPPGYFLPEDVIAGGVQPEDLVFVFSVPRNARPVETFDAMLRAVEYCRKRLGGTIVDAEGDVIDVAALREAIAVVVEQLQIAGFEPGGDATLQLF